MTFFPSALNNSFICFKVPTHKKYFFLLLRGNYTLRKDPVQERSFSDIHMGTEIGSLHLLIASCMLASVLTTRALWFLIFCLPDFGTGFLKPAVELLPNRRAHSACLGLPDSCTGSLISLTHYTPASSCPITFLAMVPQRLTCRSKL